MQTLLFILLTICKFNSLRCELSDTPGMVANDIDNDEPSNGDVSTLIGNEGYLPDPLSSINIDYTNNALILHFRKNDQNLDGDDKRRSLLDKNFMRFGRSGSGSLMRFGKRQAESLDADLAFQVDTGGRESRGDNFLRFGRSAGNLMRFGRAEGNVGPLGSGVQNRIKLSRQPLQNPMRFGRSLDRNLMRFGRGTDSSLMRFGRPDQSFMRFGRNNGNLMRFGRPDSFMRLGRTDPHLMRFGRNDKNFMRFGKLDQNFMRFGKRVAGLQNKTTIPGSEEDSLDKLWQSDASNLSESESEVASEGKSENMIPGFVMAK